MSDETTLYGLIFIILSVTILSTLAINVVVIQYGVTNDYIFARLQNLSEDFEAQGLYTPQMNVTNMTLGAGQAYQQTIDWMDTIWLMAYIIVIIFTLVVAYQIKYPSDINFFMVLFFGIFIFLFVGYLMDIFTQWFLANVTLKMLPNALEYFPKFQWYTDHVGIINVIHAVVLLVISRLNFQNAAGKNIMSRNCR